MRTEVHIELKEAHEAQVKLLTDRVAELEEEKQLVIAVCSLSERFLLCKQNKKRKRSRSFWSLDFLSSFYVYSFFNLFPEVTLLFCFLVSFNSCFLGSLHSFVS